PQILLQLDGVDTLGLRANVLHTDAFFNWDPLKATSLDTKAKADVQEYLNGRAAFRIAGDGVTVWGYDFGRNAYTSAIYGSYSGKQPAGFRSTMLQEVTTVSKGPTVFLAR